MNSVISKMVISPTGNSLVSEVSKMSSREIAELTGKNHKHIIRDIRVMLIGIYGEEKLESIIPEKYRNRRSEYIRENAEVLLNKIVGHFGGGPNGDHQDNRGFSWERDERGYVKEFYLNQELSFTLVSGYNVKMRHAIVVRWQELESQNAQPAIVVPTTYKEALLLAVEQQEKIEELEKRDNALKLIEGDSSSLKVRDAGRELGVGQKRVTEFLLEHKWACRDSKRRLRPAHYGLSMGYVTLDTTSFVNPKTQETMLSDDIRIARKGIVRLAEIFSKEEVRNG